MSLEQSRNTPGSFAQQERLSAINREYFLVFEHNRELLKQAEQYRLVRLAQGSSAPSVFMRLLHTVGRLMIKLGRMLVRLSGVTRARTNVHDIYSAVMPKQIN
jgi:hypothetical protein